MHKHAPTRGVWGHAPAGKFFKLGALRLLLRPYLYPNATSSTRVHGGSNTTVRHDTRALQQRLNHHRRFQEMTDHSTTDPPLSPLAPFQGRLVALAA